MYPDELVRQLPRLPATHPHHQEWKYRQWNTGRLLDHLAGQSARCILDLGCGNGWLTHQLADCTEAEVLGVDVNTQELLQAARLFASERCCFAYGDIFQEVWPERFFDTIILNSCIQYFPDLDRLLKRLQNLLQKGGAIHILDSPVYAQEAVAPARLRSREYYREQGVGEMTQHYFHHSWENLQALFAEDRLPARFASPPAAT